MQDFVKAVQQESDQVAAELQKLLAALEPLQQERRRLEERAKALETVMSTYQGAHRGAASAAPVPTATGRHFLDVAHDILRREGDLYYERLLELLRVEGVTVPGRNPGANLIAHMGRDPRFKRTARGTYGVQVPA